MSQPTYTGPTCNSCDLLLSMRNDALSMCHEATFIDPEIMLPVFAMARAFRLEISRALALHEKQCAVAALNGKIISPRISDFLIKGKP